MKIPLSTVLLTVSTASLSAVTVTFDQLTLKSESFYNGSDNAGQFVDSGATFLNQFTVGDGFTSWSGFAYSNTTDSTTPGFGNQYSAFPGSGADGSTTYAVAYRSPVITFDTPASFVGGSADFTNTTYAALDMRNGSQFSKRFGGDSGDDPDFLKVDISGSLNGQPTGALELFLADFRFNDASQDFILSQWETVDLSPLGTVDRVTFAFSGSDTGEFGLNTPVYFAMDNLTFTVPEPSSICLSLLSASALFSRRRRGPVCGC